jgi:type I restriction enzyme M protein
VALKKSELYSSLWASCDELRGGMDASQYKDYVLVLLFVKYVSDRYSGEPYAAITIPEGAGFADMVALKGKTDIGDQINKKILGPLAQANKLSDMPDFNDPGKLGSGKEMVERLTNLIAIFQKPALDFSQNRADGDDLLGDAYEYLMRHFATESGKSKGQFYTPAEVSRVIAQILGIRHAKVTNDTTVYDPTCGSGSLLLKIGDEARHGHPDVKVTLYGQEKDNATAGLARMNMILHDYAIAEIKQGNTLANPLFLEGDALKTFDYVVANPPFSDKRWSTGLDAEHDPWHRFQHYGVPPRKQGDYAYLLHILRSLKSTGKGACILPHGVLFRGGAEGVIRRNLIQRGYLKGIIGLPPNLFYGTGIPACIVVLDKEGATARKGLFMIDASKGFMKDGPKNRLREQDIHKIVDTFTKQVEIPRYSRLVPIAEISDQKNDYNLNLPRYIDGTELEDIQDIDGHLRGGIPERDIDALDRYWKVIPGVRTELFKKADRPGYCQLKLPIGEVKPAIFGHAEFTAFNEAVTKLFGKWKKESTPLLKGFDKSGHPKALIETIAEDLLTTFRAAPLLDAYDVYQHLMDYCAETMQDDCYLIADDGWREAAQPQLIVEEKNKKTKIRPDFVLGKKKYQAELIPPTPIIQRWFAGEQATIEKLEAELAAVQQQMEEMAEEHGGDEGLLADAANDKGKLTKVSVTARLKEIKSDADAADEINTLKDYLALIEQKAATEIKISDAHAKLIAQVATKYPKLTEDEIKTLVADDKWSASLAAAVQGELDRVSQTLTGRIQQLAERYATPLPQLTDEVKALADRVDGHLKKMGAV